jgi:hypothetical protein
VAVPRQVHRRLHRKNLAVGSSDFTGLVADAGSSSSAGYMNSNGRSLYLATRSPSLRGMERYSFLHKGTRMQKEDLDCPFFGPEVGPTAMNQQAHCSSCALW